MEWFNFGNENFLAFFIILAVFSLLLIIFCISLSRQKIKENKYLEQIKFESNTTRIFIIDAKKNSVVYFDRNGIKDKKTIDLASFYNKFHQDDQEKVKNWIFQICVDPLETKKYLEADIVSKSSKHKMCTLLKMTDYHAQSGLIHLESKILKYISPQSSTRKKKKNSGLPSGLVTKGTMTTIISKHKSMKGYTFSIRFLDVSQKVFNNDGEEEFMIITVKNSIYPFVLDSSRIRQLIDINSRELILVDLKLDSKEEAYRLATSIVKEITRNISVNGFQTLLKFTIGIVQNSQYYQDFDTIVKHAQEASLVADQKGEQIYFYEKTAVPELTHERYREQIDSLIRNNKIRYLFRPIANVKTNVVLGYFSYVKSYGSSFSSYYEMMKYANQCGKSRELFAIIARNIINRFAEQNTNRDNRLFYHVSVFDFGNIETVISQISGANKIHLVLVFDEQELDQNSTSAKEMCDHLEKLRLLGYELALTMVDKNLLLDPSIYSRFNYFVAGTEMTNEIRKSGISRLSIRTLIESLLKYEKPIIASAPAGWQEVELIVKSGIYLVSSDAIAQGSEMVIPIEKKRIEKLASLAKYL